MRLNWPVPSEFPTLTAGVVHVWAVPLELAGARAAEFGAVLSSEECTRAAAFVVDKPRTTFIASRAALRSLLGRYLGQAPRDVQILANENGKPRLSGGDLRFNLSHAGDLALVAFTLGCEIGIDLELLRPIERSHEIASRNFHPAELAEIRAASATAAPGVFLRCWTRKEAILKAVSTGLGYPLDAFAVTSHGRDRGDVGLPADASHPAAQVWFEDLDPSREYLAAVATLASRRMLQGFTYSL